MNELDGLSRTELNKLLAVLLLTDGSVLKKEYGYHTFRLLTSENSKPLHLIFRELCLKLYNKPPSFRRVIRTGNYKKQPFLFSELFYSRAWEEMKNLSPAFKTSPRYNQTTREYLQEPQPDISFLLNSSKKIRGLALRLWFDFDGSLSPAVSLKRKVENKNGRTYEYYQVQISFSWQISETNPILVKQLIKLCNSLGLDAKLKKDKRKWSGFDGITLSSKNNILKFINLGGPLTNVSITKNSKNFYGITKKNMCLSVLNLIKHKYSLSAHFIKRDDAEKYREDLKKRIINLILKPHSVAAKLTDG